MTGLVLELQKHALERNSSPSDLLRKALVICRKLAIVDVEKWVLSELNGYDGSFPIPSYREVRGEIKVWNPYRGWIPVHFEDTKFAHLLSKRLIGQSIGALEETLRKASGGSSLHVPFAPEQEKALMDGMEIPLQPTLHVSGSSIVGIVDSVRNRLLEWTLDLESRGIVGEGMTFSKDERAAATAVTYQITNNIGSMSNSQIQQHSSGSQSSNSALDIEAVREIIGTIKAAIGESSISPALREEVSADLSTLETQLSSPKPKVGIVREGLRSLRSVLEEAAGNVLGSALTVRIGEIINSLPIR